MRETSTLTYLETLVREIHKPEAEVMTMAFQAGLRQFGFLQGRIERRRQRLRRRQRAQRTMTTRRVREALGFSRVIR